MPFRNVLIISPDRNGYESIRTTANAAREDADYTHIEWVPSCEQADLRLQSEEWRALIFVCNETSMPADKVLAFLSARTEPGKFVPSLIVTSEPQVTVPNTLFDRIDRQELELANAEQLTPDQLYMLVISLCKPTISALVVDDDPDDVEQITHCLRDAYGSRIEPVVAVNLSLARQLLSERHYDVFILDYLVGTSLGTELIPDIRKKHSAAKIVLCTGQCDIFLSQATLKMMTACEVVFLSKDDMSASLFYEILERRK